MKAEAALVLPSFARPGSRRCKVLPAFRSIPGVTGKKGPIGYDALAPPFENAALERRSIGDEMHRRKAHLRGEEFLDLNCGRKGSPRDFDAVDQTVFINMKTLVPLDHDPIAHEGEEHGHVLTRRNLKVDLKAIDRFDETGEDLNNSILAFDGLGVDGPEKDDVLRKMGNDGELVPVAQGLEVIVYMGGVHRAFPPQGNVECESAGFWFLGFKIRHPPRSRGSRRPQAAERPRWAEPLPNRRPMP